jgi:peptidoglycan/xylan/chitin deacetylase (PgdA/CDA1 family)
VRERPLRALGAMVWVRRARTVLENLGPLDRVVAHWALPCAWPIATGLGTAIAIVSHGADVRALRRLPRVVRSRIVGSLLEQTSEWRFVSEALLAELVRVLSPSDAGALRRVARVEPCAIDMPDVGAAIAGRRSAFAGKALYSCVGRLVESKRVDRVIEHVATLEPSTLVVVGDGPERGNLERLAVTRGVDARFVGKTSRPEALAWIGASDALLHASREEGLSTVVREAEALGVRVVMLAALVLVCAWVALGCSEPSAAPAAAPGSAEGRAATSVPLPSAGPSVATTIPRPQLHGHDFPDKVLALTWDDGPDEGTLELARYLSHEKISSTFFVVGTWVAGLSSDPGTGRHVFETGHVAIPVLGELVRLGHRVANHTLNHVRLDTAPPATVLQQLGDNQEKLEPFQTNDLHLFRVPGGFWGAAASAAVDADTSLRRLVGPIGWDVDERDWDGSVTCASTRPAVECEAWGPDGKLRVKPAVMASRYAATIDSAGRGIVLLHDRVGHVGSRYALDLALALIPQLEARGYVFAAPILEFSAPRPFAAVDRGARTIRDGDALRGDLNGDGRPDVCERTVEGVACRLATAAGGMTATSLWLRFDGPGAPLRGASQPYLVDANGDGRADLCGSVGSGLLCAYAP